MHQLSITIIAATAALITTTGCMTDVGERDSSPEGPSSSIESELKAPIAARPSSAQITLSSLSQNPSFTFDCGMADLNFDVDQTNTGGAATGAFLLWAEELTPNGPQVAGTALQASVAANSTVSVSNENIAVYTGPCDVTACVPETKLYQLRAVGPGLANSGQAVIGTLSLVRTCENVSDATESKAAL